MSYILNVLDEAKADLGKLKRCEPIAYKKAIKLLSELIEHPKTGIGKPEQLRGNRTGQWSRRISDKHRMVYEIIDDKVMVIVISSKGHYD